MITVLSCSKEKNTSRHRQLIGAFFREINALELQKLKEMYLQLVGKLALGFDIVNPKAAVHIRVSLRRENFQESLRNCERMII